MKNKKNSNKSPNKIILSLLTIMLLFMGALFAQDKITMKTGDEVIIKSTVLEEDRTVTISLPNDYEASSKQYPVLYLLDGRAHSQHANGAVTFLSNMGIIPKMIVVSIHNIDRNRDFSPTISKKIPTSGGAEKFLDFLSDELTKYIDENYRTADFSILMGHSFGGTFVTYTLLNKPELFDALIAISPYLHYEDSYLIKEAKEKLKSEYKGQKYFFMTVGNEPDYFKPLKKFSSLVKKISGDAISFKYEKFEDENHATIPYLSIFKGLKFTFSDWQLTKKIFDKGLEAIDAHYKKISDNYGFKIATPENIINLLGYNYLQTKDVGNAIKIFTENIKRYPKSSNVYDSLGEGYEKNNQLKLAEENYQKAYNIGKKEGHVNTPVYLINLERVQGK